MSKAKQNAPPRPEPGETNDPAAAGPDTANEEPARHPGAAPLSVDVGQHASRLGLATLLGQRFLSMAERMASEDDEAPGDLDRLLERVGECMTICDLLVARGIHRPPAGCVRGAECPQWHRDRLAGYWQHGQEPTPFLWAVLSNDLAAAVQLADDEELMSLPAIVGYVQQGTPGSWGSREAVAGWLAQARRDGTGQ
jgi:hypothetical protein